MSDILSKIPAWASTMVHLPDDKRAEIKEKILSQIRAQRSKSSAPGTKWLTDILEGESRFECRGFVMNLAYVPLNGDHMDASAIYCHPWGTPKLLYWDKKLRTVVIVGADAELDRDGLVGFTG